MISKIIHTSVNVISATGVADNIDLSLGNSSYHAPLVNPLSASALLLISKIVWLA
jgi:hypothetical protein